VTALRTGTSFAEVVLLNTLLYRVEQVFLIERESGLLLQHVRSAAVRTEDADMVAGMLTAIPACPCGTRATR
jgi:OOP family OmpA-OmpF porin